MSVIFLKSEVLVRMSLKNWNQSVNPNLSRRDFLKLMTAGAVVLTFAPFVDWGKYLPNPRLNISKKARVELPDGSQANVKTFPVDSSQVVIYPKTGDATLDKEAFRTWQFIRLPPVLGGNKNDVSAFRMFSSVCLHLWCLWKYYPKPSRRGECPCHGSMYDPLTGLSFAGPASLQAPPSNVLPRLDLEADEKGDIWIKPPNWDVHGNGVVGYGRFLPGNASAA